MKDDFNSYRQSVEKFLVQQKEQRMALRGSKLVFDCIF